MEYNQGVSHVMSSSTYLIARENRTSAKEALDAYIQYFAEIHVRGIREGVGLYLLMVHQAVTVGMQVVYFCKTEMGQKRFSQNQARAAPSKEHCEMRGKAFECELQKPRVFVRACLIASG